LGAVRNLFSAYRVLAIIVGILLTVLVFVAVPLKYLTTDGSSLQQLGTEMTSIVGVVHGWFYIAYVVVSFFLARRSRWDLGFTALTLLAGLVPILIFWVEHKVTLRVRRENPELAPASTASLGV
jgi:integral membrane protein